MASSNPTDADGNRSFETNPVAVVQGVGQMGRHFLAEVGGLFWFIINTIAETMDNVRRGRVPFRASSFFRHTERAGVGSVPLVAMVSFFLGLTMALLTGYQLQRFGTERLVPGLVAIDLLWTSAGPRMKRFIDVFATLVLLFVVTVQTYTLFDKVRLTYVDHVLTYDMNLPTWPFFAVAWLGDVSAVLLIAIRTWRLIFQPQALHDENEAKVVE